VILAVYVNDIINTISELSEIQKAEIDLSLAFYITKLGLLHYFVGVTFWQTIRCVFASQTKYAKCLLEKFNMADCKACYPDGVWSEVSSHI
jgi:hypothetical protein